MVTAATKFNMIDRDLKYMKEWLPKQVKMGKIGKDFKDHKIAVYEAIRMDYLKAMGDQVREHY